jgi:hypothetical protein
VKHYSEDELTLYYYGEGPPSLSNTLLSFRLRASASARQVGMAGRWRGSVERHLDGCAECAKVYREIAGTLAMIAAPEVPERGDQYGLEVWQRIRHRLPEQEHGFGGFGRFGGFGGFDRFLGFSGFGLAAAAAVLVLAAFIAGRAWQRQEASSSIASHVNPSNPNPSNLANLPNLGDPSKRILITSVADHLDRSERVLTDIMNAPDRSDISAAQGWAEDLLTTSRLYRQDAVEAGEQSVATVLDDLERSLLEIVHSPSQISAADLEQIRRRIDAAALLFKVRVMSDELRQREEPPASSAPRTSTRKVS